MPTSIDPLQLQRAYNAAADHFDHTANSFWQRIGTRTVERLALRPGDDVLDICSGSGSSALPAATIVGPSGSVLAVDLAENLLALARDKARAARLDNVDFRACDVRDLDLPAHSRDAVVCVFGIFFFDEPETFLRALWRLVRPGGQLAITTWGPRAFEPARTMFLDAVHAVRPDLDREPRPWDDRDTPEAVRALLEEAGLSNVHADLEPGTHPIPDARDWWTLILGSGYRGTVEQLTPDELAHVRQQNLGAIEAGGLEEVETNVIYTVARRSERA